MSIPGAFDCPGAELVYRVPDRLASPDTLVVVNCAGRTRSIIGAQSLRNAGLPNQVVALENGTMGWELAGLDPARGREDALPPPSPEGLARGAQAGRRRGPRASASCASTTPRSPRFAARGETRTLYLFDVRSPEEYAEGHLAGSRSAPGGQLVQATDAYMATRNARVVLVDDDGVRAVMTGSWLKQMGWREVYVLDGGLAGRPLERDAESRHPRPRPRARRDDCAGRTEGAARPRRRPRSSISRRASPMRPGISPAHGSRCGRGCRAASSGCRSGGCWCSPRRTARWRGSRRPSCSQPASREIRVLDGGTAAWRAAGLPLAKDREAMADTPDDCWRRPYDPYAGEGARERYLRWEIELVRQIEREGDVGFRLPAA